MFKRFLALAILVGAIALVLVTAAVSADPAPSGQRMYGSASFALANPADPTSGHFSGGGGTIEPAYDDATGSLVYIQTPNGSHVHLVSKIDPATGLPVNVAPLYLTMYPAGAGIDPSTLNCAHVPADNCPDHGPAVAGAAMGIDPAVYGGGVVGHDHLIGIASSGGDFNVLWEPVLVLFTNNGCASGDPTCNVTHITTLAELKAAEMAGKAFEVPLLALTFHCSRVSAGSYARATPAPTVVGP
jgi:hypothetical protein